MYTQKKLLASAEERPHFLGAGVFVLDCGCGASVRDFLYFMSDVIRPTYISCLVKIHTS